jgi:hypothetical protein
VVTRVSGVAEAELAAVLTELGLTPELVDDPEVDVLLPGRVEIRVKASARPGLAWLRRAAADANPRVLHVLVADRVDPGLRRELEESGWGWLDRSGHIRLVAGSLQVDRRIPSLLGPNPAPADPLDRPSGLAVALCLLEDDTVGSVREIARRARVSVGATHRALTELEWLRLVEGGRRRDPDLFWAVAARWSARWYPLASGPGPGIAEPVQRLLRMGLDDPDVPGWAMVGDAAAQAFGARVASEGPSRLYVPDQRALTWALRTWESAIDDRSATALLAVPPTGSAVARRVDLRLSEFMYVRPMVVALDLASDGSSRSREVLEDWDAPHGDISRVW